MPLTLSSPLLSPISYYPSLPLSTHTPLPLLLLSSNSEPSLPKNPTFSSPSLFPSPSPRTLKAKASVSDRVEEGGGATETPPSEGLGFLDEGFLSKVSAAKDATEAMEMITETSGGKGGVVGTSDCCSIMVAAIDRNNSDLAMSILYVMRSSFNQEGRDNEASLEKWKWPRPDVRIYTSLIRGLAASLRVSDALKMIADACRVGVSPGEEVPFGKVVRCPSCMIAIAVSQPQHGTQIVSCSKCRYQYELVSGRIVSIESKEISMDAPAWKMGLGFFQTMKQDIPAAVHSIVVETPSGMARTHRFATKTVDLPAQEGERVTIALAAPANVYTEVGPFKFNPKATNLYPGEPMCLMNHSDDRESLLLRAPPENGGPSLLNPSTIFPLFAVLATGDAATGIIDPNLPKFILAAVVASIVLGASINMLVLPQLNRLPQRLVDAAAIRQELLSQYDRLQSRIKDLKGAAEKEVWMLARMCQLENKIVVVGEPSYRARRSRIKRVRESLENSLSRRIELIDSYARISSMIEIEVEMDSDVLAAEATSNMESIAEQIEQIMELESLEEKWRVQAEANDEVERLLSSQSMSVEKV